MRLKGDERGARIWRGIALQVTVGPVFRRFSSRRTRPSCVSWWTRRRIASFITITGAWAMCWCGTSWPRCTAEPAIIGLTNAGLCCARSCMHIEIIARIGEVPQNRTLPRPARVMQRQTHGERIHRVGWPAFARSAGQRALAALWVCSVSTLTLPSQG